MLPFVRGINHKMFNTLFESHVICITKIAMKVQERRLKWCGHNDKREALRRKEGGGYESTVGK